MTITLEPMLGLFNLGGGEIILILFVLGLPTVLVAVGVALFLIIRAVSKPHTAGTDTTPPPKPAGPAQSTQVIPRKCPQCGGELKPDVPEGLCPTCLLQRGIATEGGAPPGTPPFTPPSLAELAKLFPQLEILEIIGQGGMGAVYKARQPALERFVALKILAPKSGGDLDFEGRFSREARALAKLSHPNIVGVHDFGTVTQPSNAAAPATTGEQPATGAVSTLHYFIMEYVDGPNLRQVEQAGKLSPRQALEIIPQICAALQFAHDEGIVHRDIKPENVLLDKKGRVKIADFGLAKILGQQADFRLTGARDVMGTPHYMAPEQVEKPQEVDHRADIYSLGVVFYEMLTGELPLGKFDPPSHKVQMDVRLDEVVLRSLAKSPARRYQQVSEVRTELETIAQTPSAGRAQSDVAAFTREAEARDYDLDIGYCLTRGWDLVKRNFWPVIGVNALVFLILSLTGSFSVTLSSGKSPAGNSGSLLSLLLSGPLMGGLYLYFLKLIRNERPTLDTAFAGFSGRFGQLFLGSFITSLLGVLAFLCFILPGIYLAVAWMFTIVLIVDKRLDFWSAMELSRRVITKHWWKFFGFAIIMLALRGVGLLFCVIGLFVAAPVVHAALLYAYEDIFNPTTNGRGRANAPLAPAQATGSGWAIAVGAAAAIVFIAFLGIAAAIAIPNFVRARHRASEAQMERMNLEKEQERESAIKSDQSAQLAQEGWQLWQDRKLDSAAEKFQRSVELDPENTNAWNGLGWTKLNAGKANDAQSAFQKAIALDQNYPASLNGLGQIYLSQRNYDDAEKLLLQAAPDAPAAWSGLARLYLLKGDFAEAEKWAQKDVDSGQGDELAQQMLKAAQEKRLGEGLRMVIEPKAGQPITPASTETWAPDLKPGEKPDLMKIMQDAKDLMNRRQFEESLGRYIWFHNHEPEYGDGWQDAVRITSGLTDWVELGRRYPKARQALIEIRDHGTRQFAQNQGFADLFREIAAINSALQDTNATCELFKAIRKSDPALAQQCYGYANGMLVEKGEYQICLEYIGDPEGNFQSTKRSFEMQLDNQKRMATSQEQSRQRLADFYKKSGQTNLPNSYSPDPFGTMGQSATNGFVGSVRQLVEVLVGTGNLTAAERIRDEALAVLDDQRLKSSVSDAQERIRKRRETGGSTGSGGSAIESETAPRANSTTPVFDPEPIRPVRSLPSRLPTTVDTNRPLTPEVAALLVEIEKMRATQSPPGVLTPPPLLHPVAPPKLGLPDSSSGDAPDNAVRTNTSESLKPVPAKAAELSAAQKAFADSYFKTHDMHDTNVQKEFAGLMNPRVKEIETVLQGTIAEPLINEHHELAAELERASKAGDKERIERIGKDLMSLGKEIDEMMKHLPTFQVRWVADENDGSLPVDVLADAQDAARTYHLMKPMALDEHDIASAGLTTYQSDKKELAVFLNPRGGQSFSVDSGKHLGHALAIVREGKVIDSFDSWSADTAVVRLTGNLSDAQAQKLLDILNHRHSATADQPAREMPAL